MQRWSVAAAREWQVRTGWQAGCNFTPSYAINQIEMWHEASFDLAAIERELDLAASCQRRLTFPQKWQGKIPQFGRISVISFRDRGSFA